MKGSSEHILKENMNILIYAGLVFVAVPFLHIENENKMIDLIRTSIDGNVKVAKIKIKILYTFTIIFVLIFQVTDILLFSYQNGFHALFYPMQSLKIFSTSSYNLNILCVFIIITLMRTLGYMGLTALIVILTEYSRYKALLYYLPLTILVLIESVVKVKTKIYMWPTPLSLMRATGFFMGDVDEEILGTSYIFNEIHPKFMIASLIITLVMIASSIFILRQGYRNHRLIKRVKKSAYISLLLLILLTGCEKKDVESAELHNFHNQFFAVQNHDYIFYKTENEIFMKNKKTNEITPITKNPFLENMSYDIGPMFANDGSLYYSLIYEEGDDVSARRTNEVIEICLDSLTENVLWKRKMTQNMFFMDLLYLERGDFFDTIFNIFVVDERLYGVGEESVATPSLLNGERIAIEQLDGEIKGVKGNECFYLSVDKKIKSYDLQEKEVKTWNEKQVEEYILTLHGFLYSSYDGIGMIDFNGKDLGIVSEIKAKSLGFDKDNFYFIKKNTNDLYRMNKNGKNIEKISENIFFFEVSYNSDDLAIYSYNDSGQIETRIIFK